MSGKRRYGAELTRYPKHLIIRESVFGRSRFWSKLVWTCTITERRTYVDARGGNDNDELSGRSTERDLADLLSQQGKVWKIGFTGMQGPSALGASSMPEAAHTTHFITILEVLSQDDNKVTLRFNWLTKAIPLKKVKREVFGNVF